MNNIIQKILILYLIGIWFACASAQVNYMPVTNDSILNPLLNKDAEKILSFDKTVVEIGTITEDDKPVNINFTFTNIGKEDIRIKRVSTTCGCTLAEFTTDAIKSGEIGEIVLTYNPFNHPGTIDTNAFVYLLDSGRQPVAKLTLLGMVIPGKDAWTRFPYALGKLRMKRKNVEFNELQSGQSPSERILCGNSATYPLKPVAIMLPSFASFHSEPEVIEPGNEADLVITVDESKVPKEKGNDFSFPIILEGIGTGKPSDRTIIVKVKRIE